MSELSATVEAEWALPVLPEVAEAGRAVAAKLGGNAVLFYGSVLRTGDLEGLLDFYVLRNTRTKRSAIGHYLWPDVSYHETRVGSRIVRAKVATMSLDTFTRAARGGSVDTTIWARFVQPSALIWADTGTTRRRILDAVTSAAVTASRFAALHGPERGEPVAFWKALFRATYATEFRVEASGREMQILAFDQSRYERLLPLAWAAGGVAFEKGSTHLSPQLSEHQTRALAQTWFTAESLGKWLNLARLAKAAFTFDGATRYALWKIERHTGLRVPITPFRERHPILAAPGVMWRLWQHSAIR